MKPGSDHDATIRLSGLAADELKRLENLCDCFQQQLLAKQRPKIERFLKNTRDRTRSILLCELLTLELTFLFTATNRPDIAAYQRRFPEDVPLIQDLFAQLFPPTTPAEGDKRAKDSFKLSIPNYTILSEIGSGGMGTVYRALHIVLKNEAAIKVLKAGKHADRDLRELFDRETRNLGQLRHPQLVQALYAGTTEEGWPYLVMELIRGLDVSRVLRRCGPLAVADACEIIRQAAVGLQHASECAMVHRDIKPSNLLLGWTYGDDAGIKVADFGLAKICLRNTQHGSGQQDDRALGTLDYMSPEQFFTPADVDIRSDIFSLGCTLYALLVGRPPFAGHYRSVGKKMLAHRDTPVPTFRHLRPDVPEALEEVISFAMAKSRTDRFESAMEFAKVLAHFNSGHDLPMLLEIAEQQPTTPKTPGLDETDSFRPRH